jgi:CRISPR/Cas system-associated endonuclease Cas1
MITTNTRTTDPISSHIAGAKAEIEGTASTQRYGVLKRLKQSPNLTSKQLGEKYAHEGYDRYVFARRLPELEERKLVAVVDFGKGKQMIWGVV